MWLFVHIHTFDALHVSLLCALFSLCVCVCVPVSLQLSAVLSEGRPQVPGVPRGVVAHSSGSRNHDAFCSERERQRAVVIGGRGKESSFRHPADAAGQVNV